MTKIDELKNEFELLEQKRLQLIENIADALLQCGYNEELCKLANRLSCDNVAYSKVSMKIIESKRNA